MDTNEVSGGDTAGALRDEMAIRDLVASYADAVNRRDRDSWRDTWAENAEWRIRDTAVLGRQAIVEFWVGAMASFEGVIQMVAQGTVSVTGDEAFGSWTIWEIGRRADEGSLVVGSYSDRYVRQSSGWRFAARHFTVCYRGDLPPGRFDGFPAKL